MAQTKVELVLQNRARQSDTLAARTWRAAVGCGQEEGQVPGSAGGTGGVLNLGLREHRRQALGPKSLLSCACAGLLRWQKAADMSVDCTPEA